MADANGVLGYVVVATGRNGVRWLRGRAAVHRLLTWEKATALADRWNERDDAYTHTVEPVGRAAQQETGEEPDLDDVASAILGEGRDVFDAMHEDDQEVWRENARSLLRHYTIEPVRAAAPKP